LLATKYVMKLNIISNATKYQLCFVY